MKRSTNILFLFFIFSQLLNSQTPAELNSWLPQIDGWKAADKIEVFDSENLYDRINGAAPLFLENNFREMTSIEYTRGNDYITIQAYRHATPQDAFGMYASERSMDMTFCAIGAEAQADASSIYFSSGSIYVKMRCSNETSLQIMKQIASSLAQKIDQNAAYPLILSVFPSEGKVKYSEAYITSNYIGHDFLKSVYCANYEDTGKKVQLFVIDAQTEDTAKDILTKYTAFTKQSINLQDQKEFTITDRYNGDIPLKWNGRYIIGIFSESGNEINNANKLLSELSDKLSVL